MLVCDNCGEQNPVRARFCLACGHPLGIEAARRETRKTVTVVFCDVTGSTALGEQLDPESQRAVMGRYFEEMRGVLERHGGTVEKFIGDAVMAVFGVPHLHEDDALRAVRAAAEMRERLAELNVELERDRGVRIAMRIGVNTGEVVAGDPGEKQKFVTGDPVVVAKRLESAAGAGEILLGPETARLVGEATRLEELEPLPLKGKSQPVEAWRLLDVSADLPELGRRLDAPLVGRRPELARLLSEVETVESERTARLFTVVGEAGLGKSRLARELGDELGDRVRFLTGRCLPYGDGITFWPLRDILAQAGGAEAVAAELGAGDGASLVLERVRGAIGSGEVSSGEETFSAVRKLVEALARERPLVLCLEDVHWAEPTFLELLEYLTGWIRDVPVLLLCLARPELAEEHPAWPGVRAGAVLALPPLTAEEATELVTALGDEGAFDEATLARITAAAEGNPLFAEQLAALMAEEPEARVSIPPTIHALLAARLDRLEPEERAVLERAAVMGREFWRRAVVDLTPETERARAGSHLHALVRRNLIRPDPGSRSEDGFRFSHVLVRDATYAAVPKETRADLHERFAAWIEANAGRWAAEVEEIVGYHLEQAYRYREQLGPVDERARALAERAGNLLGGAGRRAFSRDDMPAALNLLDRALALLTEQAPARLELTRELGNALWSLGEIARAESLLNGVIETASAAGERRSEWYARLDLSGHRRTLAREWAGELLTTARDALAVFEEVGDNLGLARAWYRIAIATRAAGQFAQSAEAAERGLEAARRSGNRQVEARTVDALCTALLFGPMPVDAALRRAGDLLESAGGVPLLEASVLSSLAGLEAMNGRVDQAREQYARARRIYEELGLRFAVAGLTQVEAEVELLAGDLRRAEQALREGLAILEPTGAVGLQAGLLAETLWAAGRADDAKLFMLIARETADHHVMSQVLWRCAAARLDPASDGELARDAVALAAKTDNLTLQADARLALADVLTVTGDFGAAEEERRVALNLYERKGNVEAARRTRALVVEAAT
jgi:class 3 adenylate cyclase/tetratricopeptide (TPR) repeat protein